MSSLQRYKRAGGFFQLLSLIETFGAQKKEKFLEMIEQENPVWADALKEKMLTLERIFSWPDQVVIEIFKALPIQAMGHALEAIKPEDKARIEQFLSAGEKRRIEDLIGEAKPKPEEITSIMVKVVEMARKMLVNRTLKPEKFDETLTIPEDYEARLEEFSANSFSHSRSSPESTSVPDMTSLAAAVTGQSQDRPANSSSTNTAPAAAHADVGQLQRTLAMMIKENRALKEDVRHMREKLDQIKKFAA